MSALSRVQQLAVAGSVGATVAAVAVLGAAGSTAAPAAASHSGGPRWYAAQSAPAWLSHADASRDGASGAADASSGSTSDSGSDPTSTVISPAPTSTATSPSTTPSSISSGISSSSSSSNTDGGEGNQGSDPQIVDISATPGPCTQDDITASRWSTRVTITNPADAGPLDYLAVAINFANGSEDLNDYPHAGPVHLAAGATGSVVLTGPSNYFPDAIVVGGGISADGQTAQAIGEVDIFDQQDFLKVAKVCGSMTPTPDPIDSDPTGAATEYPVETKTVTATVTVTRTMPGGPAMTEPPTPSPVTTRLGVTG